MMTFDINGNLVEVAGEVVVNDLSKAPVFTSVPAGADVYIPVTLRTESGHIRLGLMDPKVLAKSTQIQGLEHSLALTDNAVTTRSKLIELPVQTITYQAAIAVGAGAMKFTKTGISNVKTTDIVIARSTTVLAEGYTVCDAMCPVDGTIDYRIQRPALGLGVTMTINLRTIVLRLETS